MKILKGLVVLIILVFSLFQSTQGLPEGEKRDPAREYEEMLSRCMSYFKSGEYNNAISLAREIITINKNSTVGRICLGSSLDEKGQKTDAIEIFREAEALAEQNDHLITIYNRLSSLYEEIGDLETAIKYSNLLLNLAKTTSNRNEEIIALTRIGEIFAQNGKYKESLSYYDAALKLEKRDQQRAVILNNMANAQLLNNDHDSAIKYLREALNIEQRVGDQLSIAQTLLNLGNALREAKRFPEAEKALSSGMERLKGMKEPYWEAIGHRYIARLYGDMKKKESALIHLQMAKRLLMEVGNRDEANEVEEEILRQGGNSR